ncbi:hypothetical protein A4A49_52899, partial [Nicotiana attenuata]
ACKMFVHASSKLISFSHSILFPSLLYFPFPSRYHFTNYPFVISDFLASISLLLITIHGSYLSTSLADGFRRSFTEH